MKQNYYVEESEVPESDNYYQNQIGRLMGLASDLEYKVKHVSCDNALKSGPIQPEVHRSSLNRQLEEVITRFESIIHNIEY